MSASDWDEIKRLAADFQRAQLSSTVQKLSDRNCIEIVNKLLELNLLDVIYTADGKEYLTPQEINKEIREELDVRGGRINLVDLQQAINVDFSHIESKVNDIVRSDRSLTLVLGQLIDQSYSDKLAEEINDKLQEQGQLTIAELTKQYDLPAEFLRELVEDQLGSVIEGQIDDSDRNIIFTEQFVNRHKAKIRGAFIAVTRPVTMTNIIHHYKLQERLFYRIIEDLIATGCLAGSISGGRREKALYIPDIYTKTQSQWVDSFYRQNGYLEYDALSRLGITDAKSYIKKHFKGESLIYLQSCCVGPTISDQVEATVDEALRTASWVDIMPILPSSISMSDAALLLQQILKSKKDISMFCDTVAASDKFISSCKKPFMDMMGPKAEKAVKENPALLMPEGDKKQHLQRLAGIDDGSSGKDDRKDQRKKKAASSSKSGGGTQGREVKSKSTKKKFKGHGGGAVEEDEDQQTSSLRPGEVEFLKVEEIEEKLEEKLSDCPPEFLAEIAVELHRPLHREFQQIVKSVFLQASGTASGSGRKKTHGELQDKISGLWTNAKLFEKALSSFNEDTQGHLSRHLLKTICSDITNQCFCAVAVEHMMSMADESQMNPETRVKLLAKLPEDVKGPFSKLHTSLNSSNVDAFFNCLDDVCGPSLLGIMLKKPDKKKERQLVFNHRQALLEQVSSEDDHAMALHLAVVILYLTFTGNMVHAPGRCVPQIIMFLGELMPKESHQLLTRCQDLVVKSIKLHGPDDKDDLGTINAELKELLPQIKEIAVKMKKSAANGNNKEPSES
ncbi:E3 UFM1-protein ligase 1-like [Lineus longissimus]|uniref:E3 UFM1-protein ligase 1-like n=1 Tax=Lineus longissimus TaxID=88925 RepID=UPI002B4DD9C0